MQTVQSAAGIFGLLAIAFALSENHRAVSLRQIAVGLALTVVLAALFLKIPQLKVAFAVIGEGWTRSAPRRGPAPRSCSAILAAARRRSKPRCRPTEFILALQALPVVLVMSVLTTLMFHWGILPPIVRGFAVALERTLGVGGAVGLSTAANVFLGMVEAPLCIKPYLGRADPQRNVYRDDRRHGRYRRHRAGRLRHHFG